MRRLATVFVLLAIGLALVPFAPGVGADEHTTVSSAEVEAFALRVEYDIPLPASPGTIAHVVGDVRRSGAGENAHGIAAAPTHFDAVVGGTYFDPGKDDETVLPCSSADRSACNFPPQAECFYPGALLDTDFRFPTETNSHTADLPPTSYATARCGAGPEIELHAVGAGDAPGYTVGATTADAQARPDHNVMGGTTNAKAQAVSLAGGAITIGNIRASGHSEVTGKPGGQHTAAQVSITDINAGGAHFDVANDQLIVGDQTMPFVSPAAQSFVDGVNAGLAATKCSIALLTDPARYPQGFLLSRKDPRIGVAEDGSFAGSMQAGLLVLCDLPDELGTGTDFRPQRLQAVIGFAYTAAITADEPGGFGLGDLGSTNVLGQTSFAPGSTPAALPDLTPAAAPLETPAAPLPAPAAQLKPKAVASSLPVLGDFAMDPATRWIVGLVCVLAWAALTHAGARRLREVLT